MPAPRLRADFMNADPDGNVRLNTRGTLEDLDRSGLRLEPGQWVVVHDDELEADGVVGYSTAERNWFAEIDWDAVRPVGHTAAPTFSTVNGSPAVRAGTAVT